MNNKVAIIGAGFVGSTTAFAMMLDGCASSISLIDINEEKARGEMLDLCHGMQFAKSTKIYAGSDYKLVKGAKVIIIAAGFAQKPGEKRTDLLSRNIEVFKQIIPQILKYNKDAILLVVTNPVDIMTYVTYKLSGFSSCKVFGSGTVLDSARLRFLLGKHFHVSPKDITAYILGEHGDSEFAWWSRATIGGIDLDKFSYYDKKALHDIYLQVKNAAYEVIEKKGATYYSIGLVTTKIVRAILLDQARVFSVSTFLQDYLGVKNVCFSVPTIMRKEGICSVLPIDLNKEEMENFEKSADKIKGLIGSLPEC